MQLNRKTFAPEPLLQFSTKQLVHPTFFTPDTPYTKQFVTTFKTKTFQAQLLLRQNIFTLSSFCRHQKTFTPNAFYTNKISHPKTRLQETSDSRNLLHQKPFAPNTFTPEDPYIKQLLTGRQKTFTLKPFLRLFLHQSTVTPYKLHTRRCSPENIRGISYQRTLMKQMCIPFFPPHSSCTQNSRLRQTAFTTNNFYTRSFLHQKHFTPKNLLHLTASAPKALYTKS